MNIREEIDITDYKKMNVKWALPNLPNLEKDTTISTENKVKILKQTIKKNIFYNRDKKGFTGKSLGRFMTYDEESGKFMSEEEYSTGEGMYKGVLYKLLKDLKGNRLDFNTYNGKYEIQQKIFFNKESKEYIQSNYVSAILYVSISKNFNLGHRFNDNEIYGHTFKDGNSYRIIMSIRYTQEYYKYETTLCKEIESDEYSVSKLVKSIDYRPIEATYIELDLNRYGIRRELRGMKKSIHNLELKMNFDYSRFGVGDNHRLKGINTGTFLDIVRIVYSLDFIDANTYLTLGTENKPHKNIIGLYNLWGFKKYYKFNNGGEPYYYMKVKAGVYLEKNLYGFNSYDYEKINVEETNEQKQYYKCYYTNAYNLCEKLNRQLCNNKKI